MYGAIDRPAHLRLPPGRPRRIHSAAVDSLLEHQKQNPWVYQDEMVMFLKEEWGLAVIQSTISRLLKKHQISNKRRQRLGHLQSQSLCTAWQAFMQDVTAEQLVFFWISRYLSNRLGGGSWHTVLLGIRLDTRMI
jgi:hypothetical protein